MNSKPVFVRNKRNNNLYEAIGGTRFRNVHTEQEGDIPADVARRELVIPVKLNILIQSNDLLVELIKDLKMEVVA